MEQGYRAIGVMERHLGDHEFFVGDSPTVADVALYVYPRLCPEGGYDLGAFPAVRAWLERIAAYLGTCHRLVRTIRVPLLVESADTSAVERAERNPSIVGGQPTSSSPKGSGLDQGAQAFGCATGDRVSVPDCDDFGLRISHATYGGPLLCRVQVEGWPACLEHRICGDGVACDAERKSKSSGTRGASGRQRRIPP